MVNQQEGEKRWFPNAVIVNRKAIRIQNSWVDMLMLHIFVRNTKALLHNSTHLPSTDRVLPALSQSRIMKTVHMRVLQRSLGFLRSRFNFSYTSSENDRNHSWHKARRGAPPLVRSPMLPWDQLVGPCNISQHVHYTNLRNNFFANYGAPLSTNLFSTFFSATRFTKMQRSNPDFLDLSNSIPCQTPKLNTQPID